MKARTLIGVIGALMLGACSRVPDTSGPLPQDVYVWQRVWTPSVRAAIDRSRDSVDRFAVFSAQISPSHPKRPIVRVPIDYAALRKAARPVALAIRIEPFGGPFKFSDATVDSIVALARERIATARANGIEPVELQIDFDCAESKLGGYRMWLTALRKAVAPLPVCPTVLPSWLDQPEFHHLARECGRYVLQVHCVAPPRQISDARLLTDPRQATAWVQQAAKLGVPFRVALPSYCYLVAFDSTGKARGVSAEGPSSKWPADSRVVRWEADPADLSGLIAAWTASRPAMLQGVTWFRLPVDGDSLNWSWQTLSAVMQGRTPASRLRLESSSDLPSEIVLVNDGERDEPLPECITASWDGPALIAADALGGYEYESTPGDPAHGIIFRRRTDAALSRLPPSGRRPIGWIRCENVPHVRFAMDSPAAHAGSAQPVPPAESGSRDRN